MAKLEKAGLATTVAVGLAPPEEVLTTILGQEELGWRFEGVKWLAQSFIQALGAKSWLRGKQGGLVSVLSEHALQV